MQQRRRCDERISPGVAVRVGSLLAEWPLRLAAGAGSADSPHEPPPLTGHGLRARCRHKASLDAVRPPLAFGVVFRPFFTDGVSGRRWEGFEPSTGLFRSCSTRLSYTTVEAIRESNPAPCGAIHSMAASAAWDGAARAASTDGSGCRTPARRACTRTAACERSPSAADSWATDARWSEPGRDW